MKKGALIFAIVSAISCFGWADAVAPFYNDSTRSLSDRIILSNAPIYSFFSLPYENPAARQYQAPFSISRIYAGYQSDVSEKAVASADGRGQRLWEVGADSYLKYKSSTLWGAAFYNNGKVLSPVWNETSDAALLYPYLTADSIGGDMNLERYSFMGGYADHSGKWSWGAEIGYLAGLYYRSVDPRPKNITGLLSLKGGAGYMLTPAYNLSFGLSASRYQQSNEISFVSETYESKIYHATGLGTHYVRFAGTGKNSRYAGWRYGASLGLTPTAYPGFVAAVSAEWFRFEKTLLDLNRLPLVEASDFDIKVCKVPTARQTTVDSCLLIMRDWCRDLTLSDEEIDKERGVIKSEYRHRGASASNRMLEKAAPEIYAGSRYGHRLPIGLMDVVENCPYSAIRSYYDKWYHPENQCVIVVGDIDVNVVEKKIASLFGDIPQHTPTPLPTDMAIPDNKDMIVSVQRDKEQAKPMVQLYIKHHGVADDEANTIAEVRHDYELSLISQMLAERFDELEQQPDAPFTNLGVGDVSFLLASNPKAFVVRAFAKPGVRTTA